MDNLQTNMIHRTITPQKAAMIGVLLVALWLIVLGIYNTLGLVFTFQRVPQLNTEVTTRIAFWTVLWQVLPLGIGIAIFRSHRLFIRYFYGYAVSEGEERNSWHDTGLLATLLIGLCGLFLLSLAINHFCDEQWILVLILEIDNPQMATMWHTTGWARLWEFTSILYPLFVGVIFVAGAGRIGNFIGRQIDQSLEKPLHDEQEEIEPQ